VKLAPQAVKIGNSHGDVIDKFEAFGLTARQAERVAAPLIAECLANLECKVVDTAMVRKYNLFVLDVVKAWMDPAQKNAKTIHHKGYGSFTVDGATIRLKSKMR
jgi:flavin reductase (DIM6/NTAB) family NADH-FMN oxidoreductase RutF